MPSLWTTTLGRSEAEGCKMCSPAGPCVSGYGRHLVSADLFAPGPLTSLAGDADQPILIWILSKWQLEVKVGCGQKQMWVSCPTSEHPANISPSTLASLWRDCSFIPASAGRNDAQQGSHLISLPNSPHCLSRVPVLGYSAQPWLPSSAHTCWSLHPLLQDKTLRCPSPLSCLYLLEKVSWALHRSLQVPSKQTDVIKILITLGTWQNTKQLWLTLHGNILPRGAGKRPEQITQPWGISISTDTDGFHSQVLPGCP